MRHRQHCHRAGRQCICHFYSNRGRLRSRKLQEDHTANAGATIQSPRLASVPHERRSALRLQQWWQLWRLVQETLPDSENGAQQFCRKNAYVRQFFLLTFSVFFGRHVTIGPFAATSVSVTYHAVGFCIRRLNDEIENLQNLKFTERSREFQIPPCDAA